jgi:VanZ family protein
MPIERLAWLVFAAAIALVIIVGGASPIPPGWDKAAHFSAFSALTLCLWRATGGAMPLLILGAVISFGAMDEWRQAYVPNRVPDAKDFLVDVAAALATTALLFAQRKRVCAESLPR